MRYEGRIYRPPSEAEAFILQATVGCSWNKCTYCDMYRDKSFRVRELAEILDDIDQGARVLRGQVDKVFVADGDALIMELSHWLPILDALNKAFDTPRRISAYAMATNVLAKTPNDLSALRRAGLSRLYIGPESGDDVTLKRIVKGATFDDHVRAADALREANIEQSVIFLLGAGGTERSQEHAEASARLATAMNPEFLAALTLTVVPGTPLATLNDRGRFVLPSQPDLLRELRTFVDLAAPTDALFRTNHASNYLPIGGRLPKDRAQIIDVIDQALDGRIRLRPEWSRGL